MLISLLSRQARVRRGAYLPHWTLAGTTYHVVFRLSDSLPTHVVAKYRAEREALSKSAMQNGVGEDELAAQVRKLFSQRIDSFLDHGLGKCWLARQGVADLAAETLQYFDSTRYSLPGWCIMPNHVHAIVQPHDGHSLPEILKSWKGYIAREANRMLFRTGEFWQPEYYDHIVRNDAELTHTLRYIQANPNKAGLRKWRWVSPPVA